MVASTHPPTTMRIPSGRNSAASRRPAVESYGSGGPVVSAFRPVTLAVPAEMAGNWLAVTPLGSWWALGDKSL